MIVAIIPARGGSKRIPMKNIRPFAGKPIISYPIAAARATGLFERIIVSTDSDEIARVARDHGAEVPFMRPAELSDDHTGTDMVVLHALEWLVDHGAPADHVCTIYATAPLIEAERIREGYELFRREGAASASAVTTFAYPILRALKLNARGRLEMLWPENFSKRSADLSEAYHDAGQFYWADARRFVREKGLFFTDVVPMVLPRHLVVDIDTLEDWDLAERTYRLLHARDEDGESVGSE